jgi:Raf kinase inhibitor-like YbhB/YbcL family protein
MRKEIAISIMLTLTCPAFAQTPQNRDTSPANRPAALAFVNTPFADGSVIPEKYTASAASPVSPALQWTHTPSGTQSFALLMHDLDFVNAKSAADALHWIIFNIPAGATSLPEGVPNSAHLPDGTVQARSWQGIGYAGPGAPPGDYHHYVIELYALDSKLSLTETATRDDFVNALNGHVLGKTVLTGKYHR